MAEGRFSTRPCLLQISAICHGLLWQLCQILCHFSAFFAGFGCAHQLTKLRQRLVMVSAKAMSLTVLAGSGAAFRKPGAGIMVISLEE
jgi:hypothetical protein